MFATILGSSLCIGIRVRDEQAFQLHLVDVGAGCNSPTLFRDNSFVGICPFRKEDNLATRGEVFYRGKVLSVAIANGKYSGGGMIQAPDAVMDDGLINVRVIENVSEPQILVRFKELFSGKIYEVDDIQHTTAKHVKIDIEGDEYPVEVDGEVVGTTPVRVEVIPQAINVIVG